MTTDIDSINIFEPVTFSQNIKTDSESGALEEIFDSVVWRVAGLSGSFKTYEYLHSSSNQVYYWTHTFSLPGTYKACLFGYKNGSIVSSSDTVSVNIVDDRDFLAYNWNDMKNGARIAYTYCDVLADYMFASYMTVHEGMPSATFFLSSVGEKDLAFTSKSKDILCNYISSFYSSPTYTATADDLLFDEYNELFAYPKENAYPQYIWVTPKVKIVLLKCDYAYSSEYELYAESVGV